MALRATITCILPACKSIMLFLILKWPFPLLPGEMYILLIQVCCFLSLCSEMCWQAASFSVCMCMTGQRCGVTAWHCSYCEHDLGWRSAADADDLCHWGGFQGSVLTAALTSRRKTQTHRHALDEHIRPVQTVRGQCPSMTHFDYSILKQQVAGLSRVSSVFLASVQRQHSGPRENWLAKCPVYLWAVLSSTSSELKMSCLHLARGSIPLSGQIRLSVTRERQRSVAGHSVSPLRNVQ